MYKEVLVGLLCNLKFKVPEKYTKKKVLIINQGALGDFIHLLEIIWNISDIYGSPAILADKRWKSEFLEREYDFKFISLDIMKNTKWDMVIDINTKKNLLFFLLKNNTYSLKGEMVYRKYIKRNWKEVHWQEFYEDSIWNRFDLCQWIGGWRFKSSKKTIIIHPGASSLEKSWGTENFIKIGRELEKNNEVIYIIGPNDDFCLKDFDKTGIKPKRIENLDELFNVLSRSKLFICNDGGAMHCASLFDTKVLGIFSYGCFFTHFPYSEQAICYFEPEVFKSFYKKGIIKRISLSQKKLKKQIDYFLANSNILLKNFSKVNIE